MHKILTTEPFESQEGFPNTGAFLDSVEQIRKKVQSSLVKESQIEMGQFLTSLPVARLMAGMFTHLPSEIRLVDAGAGIGSLSAAFITQAIQTDPAPKSIHLTAFELDTAMIPGLERTYLACQKVCRSFKIECDYVIKQEDFIKASVDVLLGKDSLFPIQQPHFNCAIMNPPYRKINSDSQTRRLLKSIGIETTNLYTAFLWLLIRQLDPESELVAIIPRSFCNGSYFRLFRLDFLKTMAVRRIHVFEKRDKAFQEGEVLQENIIIYAVKTEDHQQKVIITSNNDPADEDFITRQVEPEQLVYPDDPDAYIRIVPDQMGHQISIQMDSLRTTLKDLGITASTGRVVDFRARNLLREKPDHEVIPLIYPGNFHNGYILWPCDNIKKPSALSAEEGVKELAIPADYYVLVKRFSSKEEKRRISAAIYDPSRIPAKRIGIENHVNYLHRRYGGLSENLARGITLYLNSTLVDQYFRQFSGHTQVNAADFQKLKYPTETQLLELGNYTGSQFPGQDEIDKLIEEVLALNDEGKNQNAINPIRAKKRIREALSILQILNVPRAQQNDRSALTLLALLNLKANTKWSEANSTLIGVTEMMDYFRDYFGINYAPNTRETVRRQTIHQFMQIGLVLANPDNPSRPINSPKTRYLIDESALKLFRSFETSDWDGNLRDYIRKATSLNNLQVRERSMPMIPVSLPDGEGMFL